VQESAFLVFDSREMQGIQGTMEARIRQVMECLILQAMAKSRQT